MLRVIELFGIKIKVSTSGDIYTLDHKNIRKNGRIDNRKGKKLKKEIDKYGYERVTITSPKIRKDIGVHRLVALAFIPNPQNKSTVNHINGNKTDNRVENLEWATQKEQKTHAIQHGLCESNVLALKRANEKKAIKICFENKQFSSIREASRVLNKSQFYISKYGKRVVENE